MTKTLDHLFRDNLDDLLLSERACENMLQRMSESADAACVRNHLEVVSSHCQERIKWLEQQSGESGVAVGGRRRSSNAEMIEHALTQLEDYELAPEADFVIMSALQAVMHCQQARYWATARMASSLGKQDVKDWLMRSHDQIARGHSVGWRILESASRQSPSGKAAAAMMPAAARASLAAG